MHYVSTGNHGAAYPRSVFHSVSRYRTSCTVCQHQTSRSILRYVSSGHSLAESYQNTLCHYRIQRNSTIASYAMSAPEIAEQQYRALHTLCKCGTSRNSTMQHTLCQYRRLRSIAIPAYGMSVPDIASQHRLGQYAQTRKQYVHTVC
eukprot:3729928-Rhodomonas_salina.2